MQDIQSIFNRMQTTKKKQKDIRTLYKDALANHPQYAQTVDELAILREKKKQIEAAVKVDLASELDQLEALATDLKSDQVLLSDIAMTMLMKGERLEVQDEYHVNYDPVFTVRFKRAG